MSSAKTSKVWSEKQGAEVVQRWRASGLSQAQLGRAEGIEAHRISYWRRRLERRPETPAFVLLSGEPQGEAATKGCAQVLEVWLGEQLRLKTPFERAELGAMLTLLKETLS